MDETSHERRFGFLLHDVARLMRKRIDARVRGAGLTRAQWQALAYLRRQEGINQSGLAELLELEPITVGRLVDRMEEAGWVERRADAADRRVHRLYTTERARPVLKQLETIGREVLEEILIGISEDEREQMIDLLLRIRGNLSDRNARAAELVDTAS